MPFPSLVVCFFYILQIIQNTKFEKSALSDVTKGKDTSQSRFDWHSFEQEAESFFAGSFKQVVNVIFLFIYFYV